MDRSHAETIAVEMLATEVLAQNLQELDELQLALVSGGIADPILA